jgi:hypothetical protein
VVPDTPAAAARWRSMAEASGNVLFGAARQRLVAGTLATGRADSALEVRAELHATYADARDADDGARRVVARVARVTGSVDRDPQGQVSVFAFGTAETSLQQRIASRVQGGAGAKLTLWRRDDDEASVSLAVLAEDTRARDGTVLTRMAAGQRVRWSLRARARRQLTETLRLSHVTLWQPTATVIERAIVETTTTAALAVTQGVDFTATLRDASTPRRGSAARAATTTGRSSSGCGRGSEWRLRDARRPPSRARAAWPGALPRAAPRPLAFALSVRPPFRSSA